MKLPIEITQFSKQSKILLPHAELKRFATVTITPRVYDAVVIGAGPGGLTCASNLLDQGLSRICMLDPSFTAGRINEKYREVPSNTKTGMFVQWATGTKTFEKIIESTSSPNPFDKLKSLDQDKGCVLGEAVDVAKLLSDGLRDDSRVKSLPAKVHSVVQKDKIWSLPGQDIKAERVVLAHGSHPRPHDLASHYPHLKALDLEICLKPSALRDTVPAGSTVGVIGSSHSAVLAMMNLHALENVSVVNYFRSPLLYAIYKDGWILYDNTGLKGMAADWAREVLDSGSLPPRLSRVNLKAEGRSEKEIYDSELKTCTHLVSAIGYDMNKLPKIEVDGGNAEPKFDNLTGKFLTKEGDLKHLKGLFGAGIAYPERVTDRAGNVESAVGWLKFMKFVQRVSPEWVS